MKRALTGAAAACALTGVGAGSANAQECTLGEVRMFAGNFAPRNYAFAQGQLLPINQNQSLYSLLGTIYGGDGRTSFALPDLRGRAPMGMGDGPGLTPRQIGQSFGTETNSLAASQLPSHTHAATTSTVMRANSASGATNSPAGAALANTGNDTIYSQQPGNATMAVDMATSTTTIAPAGSSAPMTNMQPTMGMNYIVCIRGLFPSRN